MIKNTAVTAWLLINISIYFFVAANKGLIVFFVFPQTGEKREIYHFHYTTWPDFGVPESPASFLNFLFKVRESRALGVDHGPAVVHCSAGIGRSGTFSLVDTCLVLVSPVSLFHVRSDWTLLLKFYSETLQFNKAFRLFVSTVNWNKCIIHSVW